MPKNIIHILQNPIESTIKPNANKTRISNSKTKSKIRIFQVTNNSNKKTETNKK